MRRTAAEAAATRADILVAGHELFGEIGYAEASLEAIAERAGVTRGAVHHHFGDKRQLFVEVFTRLEKELNDAVLNAALSAPPRGFAGLRAACRALFEFFARADYRQIGLSDAPGVLGLPGWYEIDRGFGMPTMRAGLEEMARNGQLPRRLVEPVTVLLFGGLTEAAIALGAGQTSVTPDQIIDAIEALLTGLRPPARVSRG